MRMTQSAERRTNLHDVRIRTIRPDDWHRLQYFHHRLSSTTIELRFHAAKGDLSEPLAHYFTDLDGRDRVGLVATTGTRGRIIGVARYNRLNDRLAEVAFVIEDAYQGVGLGRRLMKRLRDVALQNGITEFVAEILPENARMFRLLESVGPIKRRYEAGECLVHVDLAE